MCLPIIGALAGRDDCSCDFFGPLVERDRADFLGAISKHPNLRYRGIAEPGTVSGVAARYDVLLLPTYHPSEGHPAVILEAYAAGLPVIASRWRSIPEVVQDGTTGLLVSARAPGEILEALEALRRDPVRYETMRRAAYEFVRSFSEGEIVGRRLVPRVAAAAARRARSRC